MSALHQVCTVCGSEFELRFSYQMEERVERGVRGGERARYVFFCSHRCLSRSHVCGTDGTVTCDACATSFRVTLAAQVLSRGGARKYACSGECRTQLLAESRGARLGDAFAPGSGAHVHPSRSPVRLEGTATPTPARRRSLAPAPIPKVLDPGLASNDVTPIRASARPNRVPRVIAIFNHKGGTAKTTTAVTLAAGLAARGQRVLLVDSDSQGNVAESFGLRVDRSLYHVIVMGLSPADVVKTVRPRLDVLPSNETLAAAELYLAGRRERDRVLATRLASVRDQYDFVLVDCSPSLSLMNQNALVFADAVLCPVACDYLSLVGVRQVLRTLKHVGTLLRHPVQLLGVLPTMFDPRANISHEAYDMLREHFGERCFEPIRQAARVKEAPARGKTILELAPSSDVAADYAAVVSKLIGEHRRGANRAASA